LQKQLFATSAVLNDKRASPFAFYKSRQRDIAGSLFSFLVQTNQGRVKKLQVLQTGIFLPQRILMRTGASLAADVVRVKPVLIQPAVPDNSKYWIESLYADDYSCTA
jgi:hypothetical protein